MIVDSSALLAVLLGEPKARRLAAIMARAKSLSMSTVNMCEVLIHASDRKRVSVTEVQNLLTSFAIDYVAPDASTAAVAAAARLALPLNLGDCFAFALAKLRGEPLLTLDRDFAKTGVELVDVS